MNSVWHSWYLKNVILWKMKRSWVVVTWPQIHGGNRALTIPEIFLNTFSSIPKKVTNSNTCSQRWILKTHFSVTKTINNFFITSCALFLWTKRWFCTIVRSEVTQIQEAHVGKPSLMMKGLCGWPTMRCYRHDLPVIAYQ